MVKKVENKGIVKKNTSNTDKKLRQNRPKKWPTKMNVSLDKNSYEKLKLLAGKESRSMAKQLQHLIRQGLRLF